MAGLADRMPSFATNARRHAGDGETADMRGGIPRIDALMLTAAAIAA
jgi:hypothetical protein